MMVYDKKRTFRYNSFCNSEVFLVLVKSGVHSLYRSLIIMVIWLDSFHNEAADV